MGGDLKMGGGGGEVINISSASNRSKIRQIGQRPY